MKQRLERALEVAKIALDDLAKLGGGNSIGNDMAKDALKSIDAILHPVEVVSEEVVRWECTNCGTVYNSVELCHKCMSVDYPFNESDFIKLTGTIRREKKVVERSVSGRVIWKRVPNGSCEVFVYPCGLDGAIDLSALIGKTGLLTFERTE